MIYLIVFFLLLSSPAYAYLGPGLAGGVIVTIIGFLLAIIFGFIAILYYPFKRLLAKLKKKKLKKNDK